jgi:hypothetical protein
MQRTPKQLSDELQSDRMALRQGMEASIVASGAADRAKLRWVRRCDEAELWRSEGARNMADWLATIHGISRWKASRLVAAGHALEELPHIAAALESGALSLDKAIELCRFASPSTEVKLLRWARRVSVGRIRERGDEEARLPLAETKKAYQDRHFRSWWYHDRTMMGFEGALPTEMGAQVIDTIDRMVSELPPPPAPESGEPEGLTENQLIDQRRADALFLLVVENELPKEATPRAELILHAPIEKLAADDAASSFGGGILHSETMRRLACDARIQLALHNPDGAVVGIGDRSQITPRWLRRAVAYRDGHRCVFPGCEARRFLTPHHVQHWVRTHATDEPNLVMVCWHHHLLVHEFGWSVMLDQESLPVWFRPSGRIYDPGPAPPVELPQAVPPDPPSLASAAGYSRLFDVLPALTA